MTRTTGTGARRKPFVLRQDRGQRVDLRFSPDELASLDELAAAWDVTRTEAVRMSVDSALATLRRSQHAKVAARRRKAKPGPAAARAR